MKRWAFLLVMLGLLGAWHSHRLDDLLDVSERGAELGSALCSDGDGTWSPCDGGFFRETNPPTTVTNGECEHFGNQTVDSDPGELTARCVFTDSDCSADANGCGDDITAFIDSVDAMRDTAYTSFVPGIVIVLPSGWYNLPASAPGVFVAHPNLTIEMTGAEFSNNGNATSSISPGAAGTLTVDGTDPYRVNCTGTCDFCGTGACGETSDPVRDGMLLIVDENDDGDWDPLDRRLSITQVVDDDTLEVSHPLTSAITDDRYIVSNWHAFELGPQATRTKIVGAAKIICHSFGGANGCGWTFNSPPTAVNRNRNLPVAAVVTRAPGTSVEALTVLAFNHADDLGCGGFGGGVAAGQQRLCFTVSPGLVHSGEEQMLIWRGDDANTTADDAEGSCYEAAAWSVEVPLVAGSGAYGCMTGMRATSNNYDVQYGSATQPTGEGNYIHFETTRYGSAKVNIGNEQHWDQCGALDCVPVAQRPPMIRFGEPIEDGFTLYGTNTHDVYGTTQMLIDDHPAFEINGANQLINFHSVYVEDTSDLFVVGVSGAVVSGRIHCYPRPAFPTACDFDAGITARDLVICTETACTQYGIP